jgi:hypothetical protein
MFLDLSIGRWLHRLVWNVLIFLTCLAACCSYALWRGGAPERIGAIIFIMATTLTVAAATSLRPAFRSLEAGILVVDTVVFVAFLLLALRSRRFWPLWMTGLQAVQVAGHAAQLASPEMMPWAYSVAQGIWSYPMMALLVAGTWRHQTRLGLKGPDTPWLSSWRTSAPKAHGAGQRA